MFHIKPRDLAVMMFMGTLLALDQFLYFAAIAHTGVTIATLITICAAPVLVATASIVLTGERLTNPIVAALVCAVSGTVLLVGFQSKTIVQDVSSTGVLYALGSAVGYAGVILCGRSLAKGNHPLQVTSISFSTGAAILLGIVLISNQTPAAYPIQGWLLLIYLGTIPSALAYGLFLLGMRFTPATVTSILVLLEPLTAAILAWLLFGESLGPLSFIGAILLLAAIVALSQGEQE
jgi:DME family drug/metabolite transporter